tara:strand:+ start:2210 stop:2335 length:126 start_codon:yes stop_codon:yes gene_type:complete
MVQLKILSSLLKLTTLPVTREGFFMKDERETMQRNIFLKII